MKVLNLNPAYWIQLMDFSRIKTPDMKRGQANDTYDEICYVYHRIRRLASDILQGNEHLSEENKSELINLLLSADMLNNEFIPGFEK